MFNKIKNIFFSIENPAEERCRWVESKLKALKDGSKLLDAGCGTQGYRKFCNHLNYKAQDFGGYDGEGNGEGLQDGDKWFYGDLDYKGNIWDIDEKDETFDAIMCTEVLEHIPYPNETFKEFSRLLKKGGTLIVTAPYACLPHMEPYFHYSGFSEDYYKHVCAENGLEIKALDYNNNTFGFLFQELKRGYNYIDSKFLRIIYMIMFVFCGPFLKFLMKKTHKKTPLHIGYMVVATKK